MHLQYMYCCMCIMFYRLVSTKHDQNKKAIYIMFYDNNNIDNKIRIAIKILFSKHAFTFCKGKK